MKIFTIPEYGSWKLTTNYAGFWLAHKFSPNAVLGHGGHIILFLQNHIYTIE